MACENKKMDPKLRFFRDYQELLPIKEESPDHVLLIWATPAHKPYLIGTGLKHVEWRSIDDGRFDCFNGTDYIGAFDLTTTALFLKK
jgi:hypothetical protein